MTIRQKFVLHSVTNCNKRFTIAVIRTPPGYVLEKDLNGRDIVEQI